MNSSKTKNTVILLLGLTTLVGAGLAWKLYQDNAALRAKAGGGDADLQKRLAEAQKRIKDLTDQLMAANGRHDPNAVAGGPQAGPNAGQDMGRRGGNNPWAGWQEAMQNPQVQRLMAVQQKGMLDLQYGALFKQLGLAPAQLDQFKNLMVQKQQAAGDAWQAAQAQGIDPFRDPQGFQAAMAAAQNGVTGEMQALLGDAGYQQYQQYQQTLPQRQTVNQLQQTLKDSPTPLTDDQANAMIALMSQNNGQRGNGNGMAMGGGMGGFTWPAPITEQTMQAAQGVLSASQLAALQQMQQVQQSQMQMMRFMGGQQGGGQQGGANRRGGK